MNKDLPAIESETLQELFPPWLWSALCSLCRATPQDIYLTGGTLRDLLLGRISKDIDLTVASGAGYFAKHLAGICGGTFIQLDAKEDVARVACQGSFVDVSAFREGASTIAEDLCRRDFTINALAILLNPFLEGETVFCSKAGGLTFLDPTGGKNDIAQRMLRLADSEGFVQDPLRMLRAYRFAATLDFKLTQSVFFSLQEHQHLISCSAPERIAHELNVIMVSPRAFASMQNMAAGGMLGILLPELLAGDGVLQPKSHHLDVLGHNLETLHQLERALAVPQLYFTKLTAHMSAYLDDEQNVLAVKWAALLHDLGKPVTRKLGEEQGGRVTFYKHEQAGVVLFTDIAQRLRWSNRQREKVAQLIGQHMRPFHLLNVARTGNLSLRATIRLVKTMGADLPGLFLLALADSLAGQGTERIMGIEKEVVILYNKADTVRIEQVLPVQSSPPLLTGKDLIVLFGLTPGPVFKEILAAVELAAMEEQIQDRQQALDYVAALLAEKYRERRHKAE